MNRLNLLLAASLVALTAAAHADTLVNLNATLPNQTYSNSLAPSFYQTVQLSAGTYTITAINGVYNGWNQTTPNTNPTWEERVGINTDGTVTFSNTNGVYYYHPYPNSDVNAFSGLFSSASAALAAAQPYTLTLAKDTAVTFYIPDQSSQDPNSNAFRGFTDNTGGVSLDVKAVTPEPSSLILLGTGAMGLVGAVRRRFNA